MRFESGSTEICTGKLAFQRSMKRTSGLIPYSTDEFLH